MQSSENLLAQASLVRGRQSHRVDLCSATWPLSGPTLTHLVSIGKALQSACSRLLVAMLWTGRSSRAPIGAPPNAHDQPERSACADDEPVDLVLSSGFLSFANHTGFLKAVQEVRRLQLVSHVFSRCPHPMHRSVFPGVGPAVTQGR